jgi:hypothetical protein
MLALVLVFPLLAAAALAAPRGETAAAQGTASGVVANLQVGVSITVEGKVTAYTRATASANGSITIGGIRYGIKAGVSLPGCVQIGATVRIKLDLNLLGLISACDVIWAQLSVSGLVTAYVKATSTANGSITIGGKTYVIKAGVSLPTCVKLGINVTLRLTLNGGGQVTGCAFVKASVTLSGLVSAYVRATATANGSITIGGKTLVIKAGASLPTCVQIGVNLKLKLTLNALGQVSGCQLLDIFNGSITLDGLVTAYVKATATSNGSITIGGVRLQIKAGVSLPGVVVGARVKLGLNISSSQITSCTFISARLAVSGLVSAYVKATATANGSITIGGRTLVIRAGVSLPAAVKVGVNVKLSVHLNANAQVTACDFVSAKVKVTGLVTAYVSATATHTGSITIGGKAFIIKAGVTLPLLIALGLVVDVTLNLNSSGQVTGCGC